MGHLDIRPAIQRIGVVVPARNEEELLGDALTALGSALAAASLCGVHCQTVIVLNRCTDRSGSIARKWVRALGSDNGPNRGTVMAFRSGGVGAARSAGCSALLKRWPHLDPGSIWLATTDADSRVPDDWLLAQLRAHRAGADAWAGRVKVDDWSGFDASSGSRWSDTYEAESRPIHGASMGFSARSYLRAGGFPSILTGEDRALHDAIVDLGGHVHYAKDAKVTTSGRRLARAPLGFAQALSLIEEAS
jgi:glycosyltransferase involved in cell wall biosynthesis